MATTKTAAVLMAKANTAKQPSLLDKNLQARIFGMLETKGKPIFLSEFKNRTLLTEEKLLANLDALVQEGKITQSGKSYALSTGAVVQEPKSPSVGAAITQSPPL